MPAEIRAAKDLAIHSDMVFMGTSTSNSTMDERVPIKGIIRFKALNKIWGDYYRRDSDKAFLIVMTAPEVEKGNGYLKQGDKALSQLEKNSQGMDSNSTETHSGYYSGGMKTRFYQVRQTLI
jgi:hypothetical protein